MIEYGAEVAAGIRTPPAVFRGLIAQADMTTKEFADLADSRGLPRQSGSPSDGWNSATAADTWSRPAAA